AVSICVWIASAKAVLFPTGTLPNSSRAAGISLQPSLTATVPSQRALPSTALTKLEVRVTQRLAIHDHQLILRGAQHYKAKRVGRAARKNLIGYGLLRL